jgi:hypothetical protein
MATTSGRNMLGYVSLKTCFLQIEPFDGSQAWEQWKRKIEEVMTVFEIPKDHIGSFAATYIVGIPRSRLELNDLNSYKDFNDLDNIMKSYYPSKDSTIVNLIQMNSFGIENVRSFLNCYLSEFVNCKKTVDDKNAILVLIEKFDEEIKNQLMVEFKKLKSFDIFKFVEDNMKIFIGFDNLKHNINRLSSNNLGYKNQTNYEKSNNRNEEEDNYYQKKKNFIKIIKGIIHRRRIQVISRRNINLMDFAEYVIDG